MRGNVTGWNAPECRERDNVRDRGGPSRAVAIHHPWAHEKTRHGANHGGADILHGLSRARIIN